VATGAGQAASVQSSASHFTRVSSASEAKPTAAIFQSSSSFSPPPPPPSKSPEGNAASSSSGTSKPNNAAGATANFERHISVGALAVAICGLALF
ncbi:hypothetical protein IWW48_004008, partial [Coemansia sp. RSA 1200]